MTALAISVIPLSVADSTGRCNKLTDRYLPEADRHGVQHTVVFWTPASYPQNTAFSTVLRPTIWYKNYDQKRLV